VSLLGGNTDKLNNVGMDIDGSVKVDFEIKADTKLDLDSNNVIKVNGLLK
jgi:hypothetical protein